MHDAKGRELKAGDIVVVPFEITRLHGGADYCNVSLRACSTMPPSHTSQTELHAVNTKQLLRANEGDPERTFVVVEYPEKKNIRGRA